MTINDPGNAECAITVGSTHRDMPHTYGVSYFSSKGPTVRRPAASPTCSRPGKRSPPALAAGKRTVKRDSAECPLPYFESSGTSMAAPHVSGVIVGLSSIRPSSIRGREE